MTKISLLPSLFIFLYAFAGQVSAVAPKLNFTDLISGPATGLGDTLGSGVIVTVWGQNLGSSQSDSIITFTDSGDNVINSAKVYYWKNADGELPGGPANLFNSHAMQEVAFSIPNALPGAGTIHITVGGRESNKLPFTVRDGNIYHIMNSGNDSTGDGSFARPWMTIGNALDEIATPGSTIYVHDGIVSGNSTSHRAVYWNDVAASSGLSNQYGIIAYTNSQPEVIGYSGFRNYKTAGQVVSKFDIYASECDEGANGQPVNCAPTPSNNITFGIQASAFGRAVGNAITDQPGGCADGSQGAISGNALSGDRVSGYQILGNEIYEYGCEGSSKFHHTTYFSVRSGDKNLQIDPWRFGWNYLHDNQAKNGIHQYDENSNGNLCGSPNGTVIINDNVIINQSGAGISIEANCPWTNDFEVYNNVIINAGLAADWDGVDPATANGPNTSGISVKDGDLMGTVNIFNNTIHNWNIDDLGSDTQACLGVHGSGDNVTIIWSNNICYTDKDKPFVNAGCCGADKLLDNITGSNNAWFFSGTGATMAIKPDWDSTGILGDPLVTIEGAKLIIGADSPLIAGSNNSALEHDIYGIGRLPEAEIGGVEFFNRPESPYNLQLY